MAKQPKMDVRLYKRLAEKKARLDSHRPLPPDTIRRLNDDLRVFLTYHSNAIEGNSLTLRETQLAIEYGITIHGHLLREVLEATNHAEAYAYMTRLINQMERISHETILGLHRVVMDKILDSNGRYRTVPVYIRGSNMTPPPAREVPRLMNEWLAWIYGEGLEYEPVTRAAIAHHGFEAAHPFEDCNGRVGRLLLNLMLMQEGYTPALVLKEWRLRYLNALMAANTGEYQRIINIIGQAVEAGLDLYLEACAAPAEYQQLAVLAGTAGYNLEYLSWLARMGKIDAVKRGNRWYSTRAAIERYQAEAEQGKQRRGRPPKTS